MNRSLMEDAFAHYVWATLRLVDTCLALSPQQLETAVPGTLRLDPRHAAPLHRQ